MLDILNIVRVLLFLFMQHHSFAFLGQQGTLCRLLTRKLGHAVLLVEFNFLKEGILNFLTKYKVYVGERLLKGQLIWEPLDFDL
jgi:hypothetical protein